MTKVWILIFFLKWGNAGGPAVIENIASKEECARVQAVIGSMDSHLHSRCIEVSKKGGAQ